MNYSCGFYYTHIVIFSQALFLTEFSFLQDYNTCVTTEYLKNRNIDLRGIRPEPFTACPRQKYVI